MCRSREIIHSEPKKCGKLWQLSKQSERAAFFVGFSFLGRRQSAGCLFLFDVKKEPKNRHRFDAVDADQGCGPGPGVCGHLTTAYSPGWGPVNKENDFKTISR